jgi:D-proline reductase (dithiol) PrdB
MATYAELILKYRLFMRTYPFGRYGNREVPVARLRKPLAQSRFALVTTAGLHTPEQAGFDHGYQGGDPSFREIPGTAVAASLLESHKSDAFDHAGIEADRNLAFPLDRFRELAAQGVIGPLNHRHFSFMGSITKPGSLITETAPQVAERLRADGVDAVFLTPI